MLRSELIRKTAEESDLTFAQTEAAVNAVFDTIVDALERGERVEIRSFGVFTVRERQARPGRNPRTGEAVEVAAKHVPFFKAGKAIRNRLNEKTS